MLSGFVVLMGLLLVFSVVFAASHLQSEAEKKRREQHKWARIEAYHDQLQLLRIRHGKL